MLNDIFQSLESQMIARLAEIRAKYEHAGDKGANIEEVIRSFLREHLPRKYGVGHGEIVDQAGRRSGQCDVVVATDEHPLTYKPDAPGIFFVEGVAAAGEVKATLNSSHLDAAIKNATRFKQLRGAPGKGTIANSNPSDLARYYPCPPYFLLAFGSDLKMPTILQKMNEAHPNAKEAPYPGIDAVYVLNEGWLQNFGDGRGALVFVTPDGKRIDGWVWKPSKSVLFDFFAWLTVVMPSMVRFEPILASYMIKALTETKQAAL